MFEDMKSLREGKMAYELNEDLVGGLDDSVDNNMQLMALAYVREIVDNVLIRLDQLDERLEALEKSPTKKTTSRSTAKKTESASSES